MMARPVVFSRLARTVVIRDPALAPRTTRLLPICASHLLGGRFSRGTSRWLASNTRSKEDNTPENAREDIEKESASDAATKAASDDAKHTENMASEASSRSSTSTSQSSTTITNDWEDNPNFDIERFNELPHANFGVNQHMLINAEFKEALRQVLWQFRAPIRYAFAYGSGVFPQTAGGGSASDADVRKIHPKAPASVIKAQGGSPKMIDFIFGVTYTQHWHSLNLMQHRNHYSGLGSLGSAAVSHVQDRWGAGVYFNPYVSVNGTLIKYGVVNLDTLCRDLTDWDTLYLAGRLQKPVKILRDDARVRLANQMNLLSALRTALLILPETFTERELYSTIAGLSYLGDPRMSLPTENPRKVANIVGNNLPNFRRLYAPLVETLPNVEFDDAQCRKDGWLAIDTNTNLCLRQDMDPVKRGNMVRRLPKSFRNRLYFKYQKQLGVPQAEFDKMMEESKAEDSTSFKRREGGGFERRLAQDEPEHLRTVVRQVIGQTVKWPSTTQSLKSGLTAGLSRTVRYMGEKLAKYREGKQQSKDTDTGTNAKKANGDDAVHNSDETNEGTAQPAKSAKSAKSDSKKEQ